MIYIIRHAETDKNIEQRQTGWSDVPLNANGMEQALSLRDFFNNHKDYPIFTSDLKRAIDTIKFATDRPFTKLQDLRERNWGIETTKEFKIRIVRALSECGGNAIIVTHGNTARQILSIIQDIPLHMVPPFKNCEVRSLTSLLM